MVVQAAESASILGEKHETNLFVDGGKAVNITYLSVSQCFHIHA